MSSIYSAVSADLASASKGPGLEPSHSARSTHHTPEPSCESIGPASPATAMCATLPLTALDQMELFPTQFAAVSPAKISPSPVTASGSTGIVLDYGASSPDLLAKFDRESSSWKTSQLCLVGGLAEFSETWPQSGTTRNGIAYRLPPLALRTNESESGLWPTPRASEWKGTGPIGSKSQAYRLARSYLDATVQAASGKTGKLNPEWIDWLMGFPIGWTALDASETRLSRKYRKSSARP